MIRKLGLIVIFSLASLVLHAESATVSLVTREVKDERRVTLPATISPRVKAMSDGGAAREDQPAGRMLLMLNRPKDREAALEVYLNDLHTPGSANYHRWLTPEAFGNEFGPSEADIRTLSQWLVSHGLQVTAVTHGRQFVEFSGTIGQINTAFHKSVHEYSDPETAETRYLMSPEDWATQYNITPLYRAGITGTGQTIGIISVLFSSSSHICGEEGIGFDQWGTSLGRLPFKRTAHPICWHRAVP